MEGKQRVLQRTGMTAGADLARSVKMWRLSLLMAWQDIRQRYRGSLLGPLWLTASLGATSLGVGLLYSKVLHVDVHEYVSYLVLGLTLWTFLAVTLSEGCSTFLAASGLIKNNPLPLFIQVFRCVGRNIFVLGHSLLVVVAVFLIVRKPLPLSSLLAFPAMVLLALNLTWMVALLALASARFRDIPQVVSNGLQFFMFITPIFWLPSSLGARHAALTFNPFYHMIQMVRGPILGAPVDPLNWGVCGMMFVVGTIITILAYARFRRDVVLWV